MASDDSRMTDVTIVGVDVGGTFTDTVLERTGEPTIVVKVPTTDPPAEGVIASITAACDRAGIEPREIDQFRHGSTIATNALLERDGATTALVTTEGFRDVLEIGRQDRPDLYDLAATRPVPLVPRRRRYEVRERTPPPGHPEATRVRTPPDAGELDALCGALAGVEAVAVSLLHADVDPGHERAVADHLAGELAAPVVPSSEVDPTVREYERTATTVASAYLTPVVGGYLDRLGAACADRELPRPWIMQSNGGVATPERVAQRAVAAVLSGPAAGVVGAANAVDGASVTDAPGFITLDMGGTSADVSLVDAGGPRRRTETTVGGIPVRVPSVDVHTVGAGGGSIAWVDAGGALRVGPASAGAQPGPACYGRGGSAPTVTDAAVVLGILGGDRTLGGHLAVDAGLARDALERLAAEADLPTAREAAAGVHRVATETMTQAIRHITVERGRDPRSDALIAFGGAGGMHAAAIADRLDVDTVVVPPRAGLLSAAGLVGADERHDVARGVHRPLTTEGAEALEATFDRLETGARGRCSEPGAAVLHRSVDARYTGQSYELAVPVDAPVDAVATAERFEATHRRRRGYALEDPIDVIACRVEAVVPAGRVPRRDEPDEWRARASREVTVPPAAPSTHAVFEGVPPADAVEGPSVIELPDTTVAIPPGWDLTAAVPHLVLERGGDP